MVIETEFTTAQLRELARWLGIIPKGNSRVGLIEQVIETLQSRVAKIAGGAAEVMKQIIGRDLFS